LCVIVAACGATDFGPPGEGEPSIATVDVHGVVVDSVSRELLRGVTVSMGGKFAVTDGQGAFTLLAVPGTDTAHVAISGYERYVRAFTILPDPDPWRPLHLELRRLAPFPIRCAVTDSGFRAVVVDLQGRKSLERWSQSTLTLVTATSSRTIPAIAWGYTALDYLQWQVTIPDASLSTVRADWVLFDSEGDVYRGSCEPDVTPPDPPPT
jgi:hypothetical protein